jgi:hypothetical protein
MTSIIINSFYRALCSINDYTPIKDMDMKKLAVTLVDALYPEDGYITLEDKPQGVFRLHLEDRFLDRVRAEIEKGLDLKEATEAVGIKAQEELTEETVKQEVEMPVAAPEPPAAVIAPEVKEVKTEAPKPAPKPKAAPKPKLTEEEKAAAKEAEKAAKAAAKEAEKAAAKAAKEAEKAAAKEAEKAAKAAAKTAEPKAKFVGNLEKMNPTQVKTWKKVAGECKVELTDDHTTRFLAAMNALDNKVYNQKKLEVHMNEFFAPPPPEEKTEERECYPVIFQGKTYDVSLDGSVFEEEVDGKPAKKVGHVGMALFTGMKMPDPVDYSD